MKITKYPQSCLLLEKDNKRIVIDPGAVFSAKYSIGELGEIVAVLYTHKHADHFDESLVQDFKSKGVMLYGNHSVTDLIGEGANLATSGERFDVAGFSILPHTLPHAVMPDGSDGPENTGYVIDGIFFHPGDGLETSGVKVETVAAPILSPSTSFLHANKLAQMVGAKKLIPIHSDLNFMADPQTFKTFNERFNVPIEVIALQHGESVEL